MTPTTCPRCGQEARGNFCASCGASLGGRHCTQCGAEVPPGSRFCTACGARLGAGAPAADGGGGGGSATGGSGGETSPLVWWVAGAVMVALILFLVYPVIQSDDGNGGTAPPAAVAPAAGPGAGPGSVDLSTMTPREAADQLFNRVMRAASAGDSAQAQQFVPMAIQAYDRARPLDADGYFHLSMLQRTAGDLEGALATAREALESDPDHVLNLGAAGEAALEMGDRDAAVEYYGRLLEVWDAQMERDLVEYEAHANLLPELREEAEAVVGS